MAAWVEGREEQLGLRENEGKKKKKRRGRGVGVGERENQEKKNEGNPEEIGAKRMRENQRRWARKRVAGFY